MPLQLLPGENYRIEDIKDLVVKRHDWIWNNCGMKGNAIDFSMQIDCVSFNETMEILAERQ